MPNEAASGFVLASSTLAAQGSRKGGRALVDGARRVRIFGEEIAVKAHIHTLGGFSTHAGQTELIAWVEKLAVSRTHIALVHGETEKREALAARLQDAFHVPICQPVAQGCISLRRRGRPITWERRTKS